MSEGLPQGRGIYEPSSVNLVGAAGVTFKAVVVSTLSQDCCESSYIAYCMSHFGSVPNDAFSVGILPQLCVIDVCFYFALLQLQSGDS